MTCGGRGRAQRRTTGLTGGGKLAPCMGEVAVHAAGGPAQRPGT
jgi:hypothetical protein